MITGQKEGGSHRRRSVSPRVMAMISPPPPPQEVFVDWLMSLPAESDLPAAALKQVARIDGTGLLHPDVLCLRTLLVAIAGNCGWRKQLSNL